jgi:hypothetical protein
MKKHLLLLSLACIAITAISQNSVPNGNFEAWNQVSYDYPQGYPFNSNYDILYRYQSSLPFNVVKTTPAYHGNFAIKLSTIASGADTAMGYFINTNPSNDNPDEWTGGMPYNQKPTGITGYYKYYNVATDDSALIFAVFSKAGINIGTYIFTIGGLHTEYTPFNLTFKQPLAQMPDAVIFAATSSNIMLKKNGFAGSVLVLDEVSFTGVTSQPAMMNGDFETWDSQTIYKPANWYINGESTAVKRTTDAVKGNYAIELTTYLSTDQNNNQRAFGGQIGTGYYPRNGGGNNEFGGFKFTNQIDTLAFWYKYTPSTDDSAQVYLQFKKNGFPINGAERKLPASVDFQYFEMPFNVWQNPDTVIVNVQSSTWYDSLVSSVGSTLIIDEIHFKSQPILYTSLPVFATKDQLSVFPNPSDGRFRISNESGISQVTVYNMIGRKVYTKIYTNREKQSEIDLTKFEKGVYYLEINDGTKMSTKKIVIQ